MHPPGIAELTLATPALQSVPEQAVNTLRHLPSDTPPHFPPGTASGIGPDPERWAPEQSGDPSNPVPPTPLTKTETEARRGPRIVQVGGALTTSAPSHLPRPCASSSGAHPGYLNRLQTFKKMPVPGLPRASCGGCGMSMFLKLRRNSDAQPTHRFPLLQAPHCPLLGAGHDVKPMCERLGIYPTE